MSAKRKRRCYLIERLSVTDSVRLEKTVQGKREQRSAKQDRRGNGHLRRLDPTRRSASGRQPGLSDWNRRSLGSVARQCQLSLRCLVDLTSAWFARPIQIVGPPRRPLPNNSPGPLGLAAQDRWQTGPRGARPSPRRAAVIA